MAEFPYLTLDVFTDRRFGGNPLAVVLDARGIDDSAMQRIAAEFGYSETSFVLPPRDAANTAEVRIFTPAAEVPFAGHPNVGTGMALAREGTVLGRPIAGALRFEEQAGLVEIEPLSEGGRVTGARIAAPKRLERGPAVRLELVAAAIGVSPVGAPEIASVGLPFVLAELADLAALGAARVDQAGFEALEAALRPDGFGSDMMLFVRTGPGRVRARMFAPLHGVREDPATGSAAAALGAMIAARGDGAELVVEQGVEMGRPSRIDVSVDAERVVRIAGSCVPVMRGVLTLDG